MIPKLLSKFAGAALLTAVSVAAMAQNAAPGKGVTVQPLMSSIQEETFQTRIVMSALKDLGYDVKAVKEVEYATALVPGRDVESR